MAKLTQKMGLPERSDFKPVGRVPRNVNGAAGEMGKADGGCAGGPVGSVSCCSTGLRANPEPEACSLFGEEQRREAEGGVWPRQTAAAPGRGSAQGLFSHPARALSASDQL